MAVPGRPAGLCQAALACYPAHTWKRRAGRAGWRAGARAGLLPWFSSRTTPPIPGVPEDTVWQWCAEVASGLGRGEIHPVFVWPGDPSRGRIYVHLLDRSGSRAAFCKLGFDASNNTLIQHEGKALARVSAMGLESCHVPAVLLEGHLDKHAFLIVEPTPPDVRAADWSRDSLPNEIPREIQGQERRVYGEALEALHWWREARRIVANPAFSAAMDASASAGVAVGFAHGDMNRTNLLRRTGEWWLLDWERSDGSAPILADEMCMTVDAIWQSRPGSRAAMAKGLAARFGPDGPERADAVMALAFLAAAGFTPARVAIDALFPVEDR